MKAVVRCWFLSIAPVWGARVVSTGVIGGWDLWNDDPDKCNLCADVPLSKLKKSGQPYHIGCVNNETYGQVPDCEVDSAFEAQAGGHIGDFFIVRGGHVAKRFTNQDKNPCDPPGNAEKCRRYKSGIIEHAAYMQFWCLSRFRDSSSSAAKSTSKGRSIAQNPHPFDHFATGKDPWAPLFFGVCKRKTEKQTDLYLVMENLFAGYTQVSQLDLKVGKSYEHKALSTDGYAPGHVAAKVIDQFTPTRTFEGRVAGYKIWLPEAGKYRKMSYKSVSPMMNLQKVFHRLFTIPGRGGDLKLLSDTADRVMDMAVWWQDTGVDFVRSISASLLYIYEGDLKAPYKSTVKFIDYAHFFPTSSVPTWPDDGVTRGLFSSVNYIDLLRVKALQQNETLQASSAPGTEVCGQANKCREECNSTMSFSPVREDRCRDLGKRVKAKYISWYSKARLPECRVCDKLEQRKSNTRGKVYKISQ